MRSMVRWLGIACVSVLMGCQSSSSTLGGQPVTNEATKVAVTTIQRVETVSVGIGTWLIGARRAACQGVPLEVLPLPQPCRGATDALTVYATTITPQVLVAIYGARAGILEVEATGTEASRTNLDLALVALRQALLTAGAWAQGQGYAGSIGVTP